MKIQSPFVVSCSKINLEKINKSQWNSDSNQKMKNFKYYVCANNKKGSKSKKRVNIKTDEEEITPHNSKCHQNPIETLKRNLAPKSTTETKASESEIDNNLVFQTTN